MNCSVKPIVWLCTHTTHFISGSKARLAVNYLLGLLLIPRDSIKVLVLKKKLWYSSVYINIYVSLSISYIYTPIAYIYLIYVKLEVLKLLHICNIY